MTASPRTLLSLPSPLRWLVALIVLVAGFAPGSTIVGAKTGVAANPVESAAVVEVDADIGPGHVGSNSVSFDDWTSGCCVAPNTPPRGGPDFVAGPVGSQPPVPVSQSRMAAGFDEAGFPSASTRAPGTQYTLPDGSTVRLMEPSGPAGRRASFENANGGPINPFTGKPPPNPPPGLSRADRPEWVRNQTHVEQSP